MLSFIIASTVTMSAAECTVKTIKIQPTHQIIQETCLIQAQGQKARTVVTTYRMPNRNVPKGAVPETFVIPASDR